MGYRIDYQTVAGPKKTGKRQHPILILSLCLLAAFFFNTIVKDQRAMLLRILFPGDVAVTAASFDNMLVQLKAGAPLQDALLFFCRQVIAG